MRSQSKLTEKNWLTKLSVAFLFSDMSELIKRVRRMEREGQRIGFDDLAGQSEVERLLSSPSRLDGYSPAALRSLRRSVSGTLLRGESWLFWRMGGIHFADVLISLFGALCSMAILRVFEDPAPEFLRNMQVLMEKYDLGFQYAQLGAAVVLVLAVFFLNTLSTAMHSWKIDWEMLLSYRIRTGLMRYVFCHSLELAPAERQKIATGDIVNLAAQDAKHLGFFYSHAYVDYFVLGSCSVLLLGLMFFLFGQAALAGFAVLVMQIPVVVLFARMNEKRNKKLMERADDRLALETEWIQGMRIVRYFGWSRAFLSNIFRLSSSEFAELKRVHTQFSTAFAISLGWWMVVAIATLAAMVASNEPLRVSAAFGVFWLSARLGTLLNPVPWFVSMHALSRVSESRLREFFNRRTIAEELGIGTILGESSAPTAQPHGTSDDLELQVSGVGFSIRGLVIRFGDNSRSILEIPELEIEPGQAFAILGEVGSGKTVLLNVLMGELKPTEGHVELVIRETLGNTTSERRLDLHTEEGLAFVQKNVAFVPQQTVVLSATVRENVPFLPNRLRIVGDDVGLMPQEQVLDQEVVRALERADLEQDVRTFPQGLDTLIGEKGINLSGGQKQRLSMSRAHYLNRKILIFDDPLSALDRDTEAKLIERLFEERSDQTKMGQDRPTLLISTHRLACVPRCDRVLLLADGRIGCLGNPSDLLVPSSPLTIWMQRHGEN